MMQDGPGYDDMNWMSQVMQEIAGNPQRHHNRSWSPFRRDLLHQRLSESLQIAADQRVVAGTQSSVYMCRHIIKRVRG